MVSWSTKRGRRAVGWLKSGRGAVMYATRVLTLLCALLLALSPGAAKAADAPVLSLGSAGEEVRSLQQRLILAGFLTGPVDGHYGEATKAAVLQAQQALIGQGHRIRADGVFGPVTRALLYDDAAMRPFIDFSLGARGQRVVSLQNRLIDLKFLEGPADGVFGENTRDALRSFQRHLMAYGAGEVTESGAADAPTRRFLNPAFNLSAFNIRAPEFFDTSRPLELGDEYLNARAAILVDGNTGEILYAKNPDERLYPASTTKVMTLLLAVEQGGMDRVVIVPEEAAEIPRDSSLVPVYPGEVMPLRDLLYGLMLRSGNDAANAVAALCGGTVEGFVERMNQRARQMGLAGTQFRNPHGYHDPEHYTTARDLVTLGMYAMQNPEAAQIASALQYVMEPTRRRGALALNTSSELLLPAAPAYYPDALGIKSGYTSLAGFCYVGEASREGRVLFAAILNSRTRNRGWADMARLFDYGFAQLSR